MTEKKIARRERIPKNTGLCTGLTLLWGYEPLAAHTHEHRASPASSECCIVVLRSFCQHPLFLVFIRADQGSKKPGLSAFTRFGLTASSIGTSQENKSRGSQAGNSLVATLDPMESAGLVCVRDWGTVCKGGRAAGRPGSFSSRTVPPTKLEQSPNLQYLYI